MSSMYTIDPAFFQRYEDLQRNAAAAIGVEARLQYSNACMAQAQKDERAYAKQLQRNESRQQHHKDKLAKCEKQLTVFHADTWFSGGMKGRLTRQRAKLDKLESEAPALEQQLDVLRNQTLPSLRATIENESRAAARKQGEEAEALKMFEACVGANKTAVLASLEQQTSQWRAITAFEQQNVGVLKQVASQMASAQSSYSHAAHCLQRAMAQNQSAQVVNTVGLIRNGPGRHRGGGQMVQHMQQGMRDAMMRQAQDHANAGAQQIVAAFTAIPDAARQRYPQLCTKLGRVHLPQFEQNGIGGVFLQFMGGGIANAMLNANVAGKLQRNLMELNQCAQICSDQEAMVQVLLNAIANDSRQAQSALAEVDAQKAAERQRIFDAVANHIVHGTSTLPQATPAAPIPSGIAIATIAVPTDDKREEPPVSVAPIPSGIAVATIAVPTGDKREEPPASVEALTVGMAVAEPVMGMPMAAVATPVH